MWKEAPMMKQILNSNRSRRAGAHDQCEADHDEGCDGRNLNRCEPVFELAEVGDLQRIDRYQAERNRGDPYPGGNLRKPETEIDSDRRHFSADSNNLHQAVSHPHTEAGPAAQIRLCVNPKRPGEWL